MVILIPFMISGITEATLARQRPERDIRKQRIEKVREMRLERGPHRLPNLTDTQKEHFKEIRCICNEVQRQKFD